MTSLSPLPKENLLHCDIVGCLDVISVGFYSLVYAILCLCYHILVNKVVRYAHKTTS